MKRFAKKAFTLVELLVVIAIIAILAVAGVVGYMAFTKKAEVNNDTSLVAELNNYVAAASATDKINTPTDIRNILVDDGIDLATLKLSAAKQGYIPGFDIVAKKFVLIKDNALADGYTAAKTSDVFAFAKTEAEANALKAAGFSLYLQSGYDKATIAIEGLGLDVGENNGITTINYTGASSANEVVIRSNGGTLNIDASTDTVKHYGEGVVLNIDAIASSSYHENGYFPKATIKKGRIVVESAGTIQVIDATAATAAVVVEKAGTGTVANIVKGENANVEVAADLTEKIATVTTVTTWSALKTEIESGTNNVIKFEPTEAQTNATTISIARSVTVLGNNTLVSGSNDRQGVAYNWQYNGLINVTGTDIVICLDSMNLQAYKVNNNNARAAVNLCSGQNDITISNSTLTGQYAICTNLTGADNNKLTLNQVKFGTSTYCSVYWRASGGTVVANHTNFSSVNTANNSQSNGFGTIVIEFAKKNGVHSQLVDNKMENNTFTLNNCTITNVELGTAVQCVVAVYSPYNNVVNFNNCNYGASNDLIVLAKGHIWNPAATSSNLTTTAYEIDRPANPSKLFINGKDADNNLNVLHAVTIDCCIPIIGGTTNNVFANDGCDYKPLYGYEKADNGNGTWTYRKTN